MENTCFIIMPPGEPGGYSQGHFNRVYDYVIMPACRAAGYSPTRSDLVTPDNPLDVVKIIIDSEILLCDLSANNSNALYGLAVRQSLDLPVAVVKDMKTFVAFDTNLLDVVDYDDSLRIDTVQKAIEGLTSALKKAVASKKDRHSLLQRLDIALPSAAPTLANTTISSGTTFGDEAGKETKAKEPSLPIISPLPDYVRDSFTQEEIGKLKAGDFLFHLNHGKGKIEVIKNTGKDKLASIQFESGTKFLVLASSDHFRKIS